MDWFTKRLTEPSSYAGLGLAIAGLGQMFGVREAPQIAEAVGQVGQVLAVSPTWAGLAMGIAGAIAMFLKDPANK